LLEFYPLISYLVSLKKQIDEDFIQAREVVIGEAKKKRDRHCRSLFFFVRVGVGVLVFPTPQKPPNSCNSEN